MVMLLSNRSPPASVRTIPSYHVRSRTREEERGDVLVSIGTGNLYLEFVCLSTNTPNLASI
jgi:hypothetical protein